MSDAKLDLRDVRTVDQLGEWIQKHVPQQLAFGVQPRRAVEWFVASRESLVALDQFNRRECAEMFLMGLPKIEDNDEYINDWLSSFFEDFDASVDAGDLIEDSQQLLDEAVEHLWMHLADHFELENED